MGNAVITDTEKGAATIQNNVGISAGKRWERRRRVRRSAETHAKTLPFFVPINIPRCRKVRSGWCWNAYKTPEYSRKRASSCREAIVLRWFGWRITLSLILPGSNCAQSSIALLLHYMSSSVRGLPLLSSATENWRNFFQLPFYQILEFLTWHKSKDLI